MYPNALPISTPDAPGRELAARGGPYIPLDPLGGQSARFLFPGVFLGDDVIWHATLLTLRHYDIERIRHEGQASPGNPVSVRQFIDIIRHHGPHWTLTVALHVPIIDEPTILKTMIMVRGYKGLRPGYHEYGPAYTFAPE
jgi:hypothetical protein